MQHHNDFIKLTEEAKTRIKETTVEKVKQLLVTQAPFYLVDVREDNEWEKGRITGAIHLGKGIIERDIGTAIPDKKAHIVLYCGGGSRSALAADNLQKMGY